MQNTRSYVVVMSKIMVKMPDSLLAITSANFVIFSVCDNSTRWRGKRLHFPEIHGTGLTILVNTFTICTRWIAGLRPASLLGLRLPNKLGVFVTDTVGHSKILETKSKFKVHKIVHK